MVVVTRDGDRDVVSCRGSFRRALVLWGVPRRGATLVLLTRGARQGGCWCGRRPPPSASGAPPPSPSRTLRRSLLSGCHAEHDDARVVSRCEPRRCVSRDGTREELLDDARGVAPLRDAEKTVTPRSVLMSVTSTMMLLPHAVTTHRTKARLDHTVHTPTQGDRQWPKAISGRWSGTRQPPRTSGAPYPPPPVRGSCREHVMYISDRTNTVKSEHDDVRDESRPTPLGPTQHAPHHPHMGTTL